MFWIEGVFKEAKTLKNNGYEVLYEKWKCIKMNKLGTILIISEAGGSVIGKLRGILLKKYKVEIVKRSTYLEYITVFITLFSYILSRKKFSKVIVVDSIDTALGALLSLFMNTDELIYFPYDISFFYPKAKKLNRIFLRTVESIVKKKLFIRADKVIHKGLGKELEFLDFYKKIKNKPHYLFREFINKDLIQNYDSNVKLSNKDDEIHFCYGGCVHEKDDFYHERTINTFKRIVKEKIHVHVYSKKAKDFEMLKNNKYFHYEGFFPYTQLLKEYKKYDFGLYLYGRTDDLFADDNIWNLTGFSNKIYDYILSGIPILYSSNMKAISEFLDKRKLGIKLNYRDLDFFLLDKFNLDNFKKDREEYLKTYTNKNLLEFMEK